MRQREQEIRTTSRKDKDMAISIIALRFPLKIEVKSQVDATDRYRLQTRISLDLDAHWSILS